MKKLINLLVLALALLDLPCRAAITFNGAGTKVEHTTANVLGSSDTMTVCMWAFATGTGQGGFGNLINMDEAETATHYVALFHGNSAGRIQWHSSHATTAGDWHFTATDSQWNAIALSYDKSATTNNPIVRVNFTSTTVTTDTAPVGTKPSINTGYCVGNQDAAGSTWAGRIAFVQVFNVVLTAGEMDQALRLPGSVRRGLTLYLPMFNSSDVTDLSGNQFNSTITSGAIGDGPPCSIAGGQ